MGTLRYETQLFELDDRVLAHLQVLFTAKLRRGEAFFLTWNLTSQQGSGRHTLWIDNGVPIHLNFYNPDFDTNINRSWLASLDAGTFVTGGTVLSDELVSEVHDTSPVI